MTTLREAAELPIIERVGQAPALLGGTTVKNGATTLSSLLVPDGVDRRPWDHLRVGDSAMTSVCVQTFPPSLALAWLSDSRLGFGEPGVSVHQRIVPVPDAVARTILGKSSKNAITTMISDAESNEAADPDAQLGFGAVTTLRNNLATGDDRFYQYSITATMAAQSPEELRLLTDQVREGCANQGCATTMPRFIRQWQAYQDSLPLARNEAGLLKDFSGRAVAMGLPTASPGLQQRDGSPMLWGVHPESLMPLFWDVWQATNPHELRIAESGQGKTYLISGQIAFEWAMGEDAILILDPKNKEYRPMVTALGGVYITLSSQAGFHINPFGLAQVTPERARQIEEMEIDLLGERIGFTKALIIRELEAQHTMVDAVGGVQIENAIIAAYQRKGVTRDPRTFDLPMPTFSDVQRELEPEDALLARAMTLFTRGTLGDIFNHQSNIPTDNPLIGIDLWEMLKANDDMLKRVLPVIVMDFFVTVAINRPTNRRYRLVLDEAHALLHTDAGARVLNMVFRIGRSLKFRATVITQSITDLDGSDMTRTLLENSATKLMLGLNNTSGAIKRASEILGLNPQEAAYLQSCKLRKGVGSDAMLFADGQRTRTFIPMWPEYIHRIVTGRSRADERKPR